MKLRAAHLAIHRAAQKHFAAFGVTVEQFIVLVVLLQEDGITQQELVKRIASDPRTVGRILELLEEKGLIRRDDHPTDGRAKHVHLTRKGRSLAKKLHDSFDAMCNEIECTASADDRAVIARWLETVTERMSERIGGSRGEREKGRKGEGE